MRKPTPKDKAAREYASVKLLEAVPLPDLLKCVGLMKPKVRANQLCDLVRKAAAK